MKLLYCLCEQLLITSVDLRCWGLKDRFMCHSWGEDKKTKLQNNCTSWIFTLSLIWNTELQTSHRVQVHLLSLTFSAWFRQLLMAHTCVWVCVWVCVFVCVCVLPGHTVCLAVCVFVRDDVMRGRLDISVCVSVWAVLEVKAASPRTVCRKVCVCVCERERQVTLSYFGRAT